MTPAAAKADSDGATQPDEEGIPNPFRADDPDPVDVPDAVVAVRDGLMDAAGPDLAAFVGEGVGRGYRPAR